MAWKPSMAAQRYHCAALATQRGQPRILPGVASALCSACERGHLLTGMAYLLAAQHYHCAELAAQRGQLRILPVVASALCSVRDRGHLPVGMAWQHSMAAQRYHSAEWLRNAASRAFCPESQARSVRSVTEGICRPAWSGNLLWLHSAIHSTDTCTSALTRDTSCNAGLHPHQRAVAQMRAVDLPMIPQAYRQPRNWLPSACYAKYTVRGSAFPLTQAYPTQECCCSCCMACPHERTKAICAVALPCGAKQCQPAVIIQACRIHYQKRKKLSGHAAKRPMTR